jgi:hypothetical protein
VELVRLAARDRTDAIAKPETPFVRVDASTLTVSTSASDALFYRP